MTTSVARILCALAATALAASGCVSTFDPDSVALEDDRDVGGGDTDTDDDLPEVGETCGEEGEPCDLGQPGVVATCQSDVCTPTGCADGLGNCNDDFVTDGCETPLDSVDDCGGCGTRCEGANAAWVCEAGSCAIDACDNGWRDQDGMVETGCELAVPPTPVVDAVDVRNHGIHVEWSAADSEADIVAWLVSWGPDPGNLGRSRRIEGSAARSATVGPIATESTVHVGVTAIGAGDPEIAGEPSETLEYDFVPAGWFNHSLGRFWTDGRFIEGHGGILAAYGHVAHVTTARGAPVPGKLARPRQIISVDFHGDGPQAGRGVVASFEGVVGVTDDYGVTWTEHRVPGTDEGLEGLGLFGAALLTSGRIVTCGDQVTYSDNYGESFEVVADTDMAIYFGIATLEADAATYVFCQGISLGDANVPIVTWSGDGGDTWTKTTPNLDFEPRFDISGGIHMRSPTEGIIGSLGGFLRTTDQWNSAEFVELDTMGEDTAIFRIDIDDSGFGLAATVNNAFVYTTEDAGQNWTREENLPELPGEDIFFPGLVSMEGVDGDPFLLLSSEGSVFRWDGAPGSRTFTAQRRGFVGDLVGVSTNDGAVLAIAANQAVLRGADGPDSLRPEGVVANDSRALTASAASRGGELLVAVGDGGQLHTSRDNGRAWETSEASGLDGLDFVDVDVDDRGSMGFAIGDGGPNRGMTVVQLLGNPPQVQVLSFREIDPQIDPAQVVPRAVDISNDGSLVVIAASHVEQGRQYFFVGRGGSSRVWTTFAVAGRSEVRGVGLIRASTDFYAVGTAGFFVRMTDGEPNSVELPLPRGLARGDFEFSHVTFPHDRLNGWAYTQDGWVFATTDGGATWAVDRAVSGPNGEGDSNVDFPHRLGRIWVEGDNQHAIIVGQRGTVVRTANGGVPNPPLR